jgi:hypothetical protein
LILKQPFFIFILNLIFEILKLFYIILKLLNEIIKSVNEDFIYDTNSYGGKNIKKMKNISYSSLVIYSHYCFQNGDRKESLNQYF